MELYSKPTVGIHWLNMIWKSTSADGILIETYTYQLMRELEEKHWWFVARRNILESVLSTLQLPETSNILEVGCGTGGNITFLRQLGDLICVESDGSAAELAR